ncbi:hypothetical protein FN846DRAFT_914673 [Sphaerosporella brunnea]|uniref:Uncharacterized protein n=1 Tax=Sphaerosporella brunnea TaxID=1250544 RepID=A0A5J5EC53_9PEZI|nr:hypothetical protein FN846DRAFT_914673 [Sphaerosporella brunnea]
MAQGKEKEDSEIQRRFMFAHPSQKRRAGLEAADGEGEKSGNAEVVVFDVDATNKEVAWASAQSRKRREIKKAASVSTADAYGDGLIAVEEAKFQELRQEIAPDREDATRHRELMQSQRIEDQAQVEMQRAEDLERMERQIELKTRQGARLFQRN